MNQNKIILGTAQFGLDYGINNERGKIPKSEVFEILSEAYSSGIDMIDTASAYGESEAIIGEFIKEQKKQFKVISKLSKCNIKKTREIVDFSLKNLNMNAFYGYLIHRFQDFKEHPEILENMRVLKSKGKINKIGFSLYFIEELEYLFESCIKIDIIQVPYSIFDCRFEKYFKKLKDSNIEIHVRSVFLQGLVFKSPERLNGYFKKIKDKITVLNKLSEKTGVPIVAICLNFAVFNNYIDKVVVGIDNINNLKDILLSSKYLDDIKNIYNELSNFKEDDEKIILPFNWNLSNGLKN